MRLMLAAAFVACATVAYAEDRWMTIPKPPAMPAPASTGKASWSTSVNTSGRMLAAGTVVDGEARSSPVRVIHTTIAAKTASPTSVATTSPNTSIDDRADRRGTP